MKKTVTLPDGRRITTMELKDLSPLSAKEKEQIRQAAALPIAYDDDCPPIPAEMMVEMEKEIQKRAAM